MNIKTLSKKNFSQPDSVEVLEKSKFEVVKIEGFTFRRITFEPGFKWSIHIKPVKNDASCQLPHVGYFVSGKLHVAMDNGASEDFAAGDIEIIPPGHDSWVVGKESVIIIDIAENFK